MSNQLYTSKRLPSLPKCGIGQFPNNYLALVLKPTQPEIEMPNHYESIHDWYHDNIPYFYNCIADLHASISHKCTATTCPIMSAGADYTYKWQDISTKEYQQPTSLTANEYINVLLNWVVDQCESTNQQITPEDDKLIRINYPKIYSRLFRIYAHFCISHHQDINECGGQSIFVANMEHFLRFIVRHNLVPVPERIPLQNQIDEIKSRMDILQSKT